MSRFILPAPVLFFPALCNMGLTKLGLMPRNSFACKLIELGLCMASLSVALPLACSIFEQRAMLTVEQLEPEFKDTKDDSGEAVTNFYFNKGL